MDACMGTVFVWKGRSAGGVSRKARPQPRRAVPLGAGSAEAGWTRNADDLSGANRRFATKSIDLRANRRFAIGWGVGW